MAQSSSEAARILRLQDQREKQKKEAELLRQKIKDENKVGGGVGGRFAATSVEKQEEQFKIQTIGLVTADEFRLKRKLVYEAEEAAKREKELLNEPKKPKKKKRKVSSGLSFDMEEDGEDITPPKKEKRNDESTKKFGKLGKNPTVDTSFLPDRDREEADRKERERLKQLWLEEQERIKEEIIEVTYSYYDGSGHRRSLKLKKGTTIEKFLDAVRKEFKQLRGLSVDELLYIKEDLIIPQHFSFYDLIVTKARGKSGPLFHFDVHEDVRMLADAKLEKDESHAGKVVERSWYEKNKHLFPASRWEVYDPKVKWDKYTIHDKRK